MGSVPEIDKQRLRRSLLELLERDLAKLEQSQKFTQRAATHEEAKPENDKDTRALESSYLARGQAKRVLELREEIAQLRAMACLAFESTSPIALSALVELESDEGAVHYWLVPAGAGLRVEVDGRVVRIVTPASPLGRGLLRKLCGDTLEIHTPQGLREYEVVSIC